MHHLERKGERFVPDLKSTRPDARQLLPTAKLVLEAAQEYLLRFIGDMPEARPLYARIESLSQRVVQVDRAHMQWRDNLWQERQATAEVSPGQDTDGEGKRSTEIA